MTEIVNSVPAQVSWQSKQKYQGLQLKEYHGFQNDMLELTAWSMCRELASHPWQSRTQGVRVCTFLKQWFSGETPQRAYRGKDWLEYYLKRILREYEGEKADFAATMLEKFHANNPHLLSALLLVFHKKMGIRIECGTLKKPQDIWDIYFA